MPDLYLQDLLRDEVGKKQPEKKKKDRFEIEIENQVEEYIKSISFDEEDPSKNLLMAPEVRRAKMKMELIQEAKCSKLSSYVESAIAILRSEGKNYLDEEKYMLMNKTFENAYIILNKIDLTPPFIDNFQTLLEFSDDTIESIFNIAVIKHRELKYEDSLSLFILLLTLIPENSDYWYRAGMVAYECKKYELALDFYSVVSSLDPLFIAPWIFSSECYLKLNSQVQAKSACEEAIKISAVSEIDDPWKEALSRLQAVLN